MPQYYTLEEAAKVLQMRPEELREKAKKKEIRAFQDRGNWRFLAQQIDEEARKRGLGSDPDLQPTLSPPPLKKNPPKGGDDRLAVDFDLEDDSVPIGKEKPDKTRSSKSGPKSPKPTGDSDVRLVLENEMDFQIELDSDVKVEPSGPKGGPKSSGSRAKGERKSKIAADSNPRMVEKPSDSDVQIVPSPADSDAKRKGSKPQSDSDIRLIQGGSGKKKGPDAGIITEEIDLDAEEAREALKPKPKKPLTKASAPVLPTSSPFELSEDDLNLDEPPPKKGSKGASKAKKDHDSSSDFELIAFDASKSPADQSSSGDIPLLADDEVSLGDLPTPNAGNSGINLQDPADSGISLESGGSDEIEFELSLDEGSTPKPVSQKKVKQEDSSSEFELSLDDSPSDPSDSEFELSLDESSDQTVGLKVDENSDSEFELTLDDDGGLAGVDDEDGKDIFEETNFEVPALEEGEDSGSQAVALDEADTDLEASDFEISLDDDSDTGEESESQVVALGEEEEADDAAATIARPRKGKSKSKAKLAPDEEDEGLDLEDLESSGARPKRKTADEDEETAESEQEDEEDEVVSAAPAAPAEWGPLPAILLAPTVLVMFVVALMGFELVQSMWGYHRPAKVGRPVVDFIARSFDESLPKD